MQFDAAAARASYTLTFAAAHRTFHEEGIDGPNIDDANHPNRKADGNWLTPDWLELQEADASENVWRREMFSSAVAEAVHEVCEHFRWSGNQVVNPHGIAEDPLVSDSILFGREIYEKYNGSS